MIDSDFQREKQELEYQRFCTYLQEQVLGVQIQGEYLYLVQPSKISVYQYHGHSTKPQIIQELIYNKVILNYSISEFYICIQSPSLIQVRDRRYWGNLIYSTPISQKQSIILLLQGDDLYLSNGADSTLQFQRVNLKAKQMTDVIHLGNVAQKDLKSPLLKKPIFLREMGAIQDFYIWGKNNNTIEIGMLYVKSEKLKGKYEINQIELQQSTIQKMYHHKIFCSKYPKQSVQLAIIISQNSSSRQISLSFIQLLPKNQEHHPQSKGDSFESLINQFAYLGKLSDSNTNSLLKQVLTDEYAKNNQQRKDLFSLKLQKLKNYQTSFYKDGRLWIVSSDVICQIELIKQQNVENIIRSRANRQEMIIKSKKFQVKNNNKKCFGVYKDSLLFSQKTTSFLIGIQKEQSESIAEEIIEGPQFQQEVIEEISSKKNLEDIEELCNHIIECALEQRSKQILNQCQKQEGTLREDFTKNRDCGKSSIKNSMESKVFSENYHLFRVTSVQYATQTEQIHRKTNQLQEIELLVAKYSSMFNNSCVKIKQNHFQKQKFEKQIFNIVDNMAKNMIQPYLEEKFVSLLEIKIKQISQKIHQTLKNQLEALNETMRKIQIKENHLRGRRIFEFSKQIQNMKDSVTAVVDALKQRQINRYAFNEVVLDEAKILKEKIKDIEIQIIQISSKNEANQIEINTQITEITELIEKMCSKENQIESQEENESEMDESDDECSQGQNEENLSEGQNSQRPPSVQEQQNEGKKSYHYYPQHNPYAYKGYPLEGKGKSTIKHDSKRYPTPGYPPQFYSQPPQYPQIPFYYPYAPHPVTPSFQNYFPPHIPHPQFMMERPNQTSKKGKTEKKKGKKN